LREREPEVSRGGVEEEELSPEVDPSEEVGVEGREPEPEVETGERVGIEGRGTELEASIGKLVCEDWGKNPPEVSRRE